MVWYGMVWYGMVLYGIQNILLKYTSLNKSGWGKVFFSLPTYVY